MCFCRELQEDSQGSRSGSINSRVSELSFSSASRAAGSGENNLPAMAAAQLVCYCLCAANNFNLLLISVQQRNISRNLLLICLLF